MVCGKHQNEVGPISWRGKCADCGHKRLRANMDGIHYHTGPELLRWRRAVAHSVGAVLLDDIEGRT